MDPTTRFGRFLIRVMTKTHVALYRLTRGRVGHRMSGGVTTLLLDHVGARSGANRTTPVNYFKDGDDLVIVASLGGAPTNPAWFHNLRANPDTTVQIGDEARPVRARLATSGERARLWPTAVAGYPPFTAYQEKAEQTGRQIPMLILQRRTPTGPAQVLD